MSFSKKIIILSLASIIIGAIALPVKAQQTKSYCWQKKDCESKDIGGEWNAPKKGDCLEGYGYCTGKEKSLNLQVPIGDLKNTTGLNQYIPAIYNYLIAIVGIVAIVMIMVGGLQYLTSGSSGRVQEAKNRIIGAVIGLVLALASYTILQTINPNLVKMQLPIKVKMVAPQWAAQKCPNTGIYEGEFQCGKNYTLADKGKSGNPPPIKSGSCKGVHCPKGSITYVCTHLTYDGTKSPECAHQNAVKACEMMKKMANGCLNSTAAQLKQTYDTGGWAAIFGAAMPLESAWLTINNLKDVCYSAVRYTVKASNKLEFDDFQKFTDQYKKSFTFNNVDAKITGKDQISFSLCRADIAGCGGHKKETIDTLCKFLKDLPSDSGFFADGAF